jgi:predicted choloylglycine hydrolase
MSVTTVVGDESTILRVHHVVAAGTERQIGQILATAGRDAGGEPRLGRVDPDVERVRRRWFEQHYPPMAQRSRGVADALGLADDAAVALDAITVDHVAAACSVAFVPGADTADGHPVLARNMDFPTVTLSEFFGRAPRTGERAAVADTWIVELHPDEGHASLCVGFGDVMGGMDGVNDAGLAVALLADDANPALEPSGAPQVGLSEGQVVRYLLDTCDDVTEAKDALRIAKHYYRSLPCHYVIADRHGDSFVWEHSRHRNRELVVQPGRRPVCTNHLLHDDTAIVDDTSSATASHTHERWRRLAAASRQPGPVSRADITQQFATVRFDDPADTTRTIWHAVYDLADSSVDIEFYLGDVDCRPTYSTPLHLDLTTRSRSDAGQENHL